MSIDIFFKHNSKAFTLVEIMLASAILVSITAVFLSSFNTTLQSTNYTQGIALATRAAQNKVEEIINYDFDRVLSDYAAGGAMNNTFAFSTSGLTGMGYVNITDRKDLYGGGEILACANASWSARTVFQGLVYDNKMWVLGGTGSFLQKKNDVWYSIDGVNWTNATNAAAWPARYGFSSVVYDNKMWIMGGTCGDMSSGYQNDVWYSSNGANWTCATNVAAWPARYGAISLVYDNKMWIMGGLVLNGTALANDVWYSFDGVNWTNATSATLRWSPRVYSSGLVYANKMWIFGGSGSLNDVWYSSNGADWTCAANAANWSAGNGHTSLVYDNKMWIFGGTPLVSVRDVWYSSNGANWTRANDNASWGGRAGGAALVYDNKMWLIGGEAVLNSLAGYRNDVWFSGGYNRLLDVFTSVSWRHPDNRTFGEDINFNGSIDTGEDINGNGLLDSPAQARALISGYKNKGLSRIFFGK